MAATAKPAAPGPAAVEHSPPPGPAAVEHSPPPGPAAVEHSPASEVAGRAGSASFGQGQPAPIRLRPLTEADLPLLGRWFAAAHVERWWHASSDPGQIRAEYLPCIEGSEPSHGLIAELPTGPFGYAQWCRWSDYPEHARKMGAEPDEAGFDYLIGSPQDCGQGVGTRLIAALVSYVRESDPTVAGFVVDPEVANIASRRVLEKNGFELVAVKSIPDPDGHPIGPTAVYRRRLVSSQPARSVGDLSGS